MSSAVADAGMVQALTSLAMAPKQRLNVLSTEETLCFRPSDLSAFLDDSKTSLHRYAKDAMTADGLGDATLMMGLEKGLPILRDYPDEGAAVVDATCKLPISPQLPHYTMSSNHHCLACRQRSDL